MMQTDPASQKTVFFRLDQSNADQLRHATMFDDKVRPEQLAGFVDDPNHEMIVASREGTPVGFASGCILLHPDKDPVFFISEVGVEPSFRQQGIGRQLVRRLLDLAHARGCRDIWLATEPDNVAARALYRSLAARETQNIVVYDWGRAMDP